MKSKLYIINVAITNDRPILQNLPRRSPLWKKQRNRDRSYERNQRAVLVEGVEGGQEATRERRRSTVDYFTWRRARIDFLSIITAHRASVKVSRARKERNGRCEKDLRPRRAKGEPTKEREEPAFSGLALISFA